MMSNGRTQRWVGLLSVTLLTGTAVLLATTTSNAEDDPQALNQANNEVVKEGTTTVPGLDKTNLDLWAGLDEKNSCLLNHSVFPAGGIGFEDSSLPYDNLQGFDKNLSVFRAELIRSLGDEISGTNEILDEDQRVVGLTLYTVKGTGLTQADIDRVISSGRQEFRQANEELKTQNFTVEIQETANYNLYQICEAQEQVSELADEKLIEAGILTVGDPQSGQLQVTVPPGYGELAHQTYKVLGDKVIITEDTSKVSRSGR